MWKTFTMQWIKLIHHFFSIALLQNRSDWLIRNNWRPSVCPFAEKCAHVYLFFCAKTQIMQKRFLENLKSSYILSVGSTNCIWRPPKFRFSKSACVGGLLNHWPSIYGSSEVCVFLCPFHSFAKRSKLRQARKGLFITWITLFLNLLLRRRCLRTHSHLEKMNCLRTTTWRMMKIAKKKP